LKGYIFRKRGGIPNPQAEGGSLSPPEKSSEDLSEDHSETLLWIEPDSHYTCYDGRCDQPERFVMYDHNPYLQKYAEIPMALDISSKLRLLPDETMVLHEKEPGGRK
jgi:hypothetical protein